MNIKKVFVTLQFFYLVIFCQAVEPPLLEIDVLNPLEETSGQTVIEVSNLEKVEVKISLEDKVVENNQLPSLSGITINPKENQDLKHWIEISASTIYNNTRVNVLTSLSKKKLPLGQISFSLHFPQDDNVIEENISQYINGLKRSTEDKFASDPSNENRMGVDFFNVHGEKLQQITGLIKERYYFENRVGIYNLKVAYLYRDEDGNILSLANTLPALKVKNLGSSLCKIFEVGE